MYMYLPITCTINLQNSNVVIPSNLRRLLDFIHSPFTVGIATAAPSFAKEKWVYLGLTKLGQPPTCYGIS